MTRELIERAFDAVGTEAAKRGIVAEIAVYGGSCIMLASDIRNASGDVDAVFLSDQTLLYEMADRVGRLLGLPPDWLNQAVRRVAPPPGGREPNLLPFGEYPLGSADPVGLRVFLPSPAYMLAMKLLANRGDDDPVKAQTDLLDISGLITVTGIDAFDALAALLQKCYPRLPGLDGPALPPRLRIKIEAVIDVHRTGPNATTLSRPGKLAEVLQRARSGGSFDEAAFRTAFAEFLDDFYRDHTRPGRKARVEGDPGLTGTARIDAYVGAVGEHLWRRRCLGEPPARTDAPERFLHWPTFLGPERMKGFHLAESPSAFRRRMLFTEAEPLRRARMPRDGRWWAYEEMRSGLTPEPGEVDVIEQARQAEE